MADIDLSNVITPAVTAAVTKVAENQNNSLQQQEVAAASKTVVAAITPAIEKEATAVITNMTNQEPLLQSRNMWTFAIILVSMGASAIGYTIAAEDQTKAVDTIIEIMKIVPIATAGVASLWGMINRIRAGQLKPLGE